MPLRRSLATTAAAVLLAAPLLTSCGFNAGTDRVSTLATGTNDRTGTVSVLAAVVVATRAGEGTFIAGLANKSATTEEVFASVQGSADEAVTAAGFKKIKIPAQGYVNLATAGGVKLTGNFGAGDVIPLSIGFDNGQTISIDVPVVRACHEYEGLDPAVSESAAPTADPTAVPTDASPSDAASASPSAVASPTETSEPYSCSYAADDATTAPE